MSPRRNGAATSLWIASRDSLWGRFGSEGRLKSVCRPKNHRERRRGGLVAPCLLALFVLGLVLPVFYTADDDVPDPAAVPATFALDLRPVDGGAPFISEPAERSGAACVVRRDIERGPPLA
jgi:hypothetical protein